MLQISRLVATVAPSDPATVLEGCSQAAGMVVTISASISSIVPWLVLMMRSIWWRQWSSFIRSMRACSNGNANPSRSRSATLLSLLPRGPYRFRIPASISLSLPEEQRSTKHLQRRSVLFCCLHATPVSATAHLSGDPVGQRGGRENNGFQRRSDRMADHVDAFPLQQLGLTVAVGIVLGHAQASVC